MTDKPKFPFKPANRQPDKSDDASEETHRLNQVFSDSDTHIDSGNSDDHDVTKITKKTFQTNERIRPVGNKSDQKPQDFKLGPYRVFREIAKGGMGSVYDGEDPVLHRRVAIKIMAPDLVEDEEAVKRFEREARATASIDHPNVARVYMVGTTENGSPYLAMEWVGGGTLESIIKNRQRLPYSKIADLMIQTCGGLEAAYRQTIIHRDIKPANLMLTEDNVIKIVDFGLAKFFREETFRTMAGMVMGTPRYMSPEQSQGREVDLRSDIYSLGATMYHLLSGRSPFDGDNATQIMMKQVTAPLISMRSFNPEIPVEFDDLVRKCMAKDPSSRYQNYPELISALSQIKLQWTSREQGSIINGPLTEILPANGMDTRGNPLPPTDTVKSKLPSLEATINGQQEEEPHHSPKKFVVIAGVALAAFVLLIAIVAMTRGGDEENQTVVEGKKTGLRVLLEAITSAQDQSNEPDIPPIDSDYLAYLATETILENLHEGLNDYRIQKGNFPKKLSDLIDENVVFQNFDLNNSNDPLDGWETPIEYRPSSQTLISAGLDLRLFTEDDLVLELNDSITIEDDLDYQKLILEENKRQQVIEETY